MLRDILYRLCYHKDILLCLLLYDTYTLYLLDKHAGTAIENRHFGRIHINDTVIYPHGVQGTQGVLYRGDLPFTALEHGAALGAGNIVSQSLVARFLRQIHAAETDTGIDRRRVKSSRDLKACMQTYRTQRKLRLNRFLFHDIDYLLFSNACRRLRMSGSCLNPTVERRQLAASIAG